MDKHWRGVVLLLGIAAGRAAAQAPDYAPPQPGDPLPVAQSVVPAQASGPVGVPGPALPGPEFSRLLNSPNAFGGGKLGSGGPAPAEDCWFAAEGMFAWANRAPLHTPLVTTSLNTATSAGAIGQAGTQILLGDNGLSSDLMGGARLTFGVNVHEESLGSIPVEFTIFYISQSMSNFAAQSDANGNPTLARPIFLTQLGTEGSFVSAFPGLSTGSIDVSSSSQLWGFELNAFSHSATLSEAVDSGLSLEFLAGFRFADLGEGLQVFSSATPLPSNPQFAVFFNGSNFGPGNTTLVTDVFRTHNTFVGAQVGAHLDWQSGPLFINLGTKIGIGAMDQVVDIAGTSTLVQSNGTITSLPGGLLAVASNSGHHERTRFAFLPEETLTVGLEVCPHVRLQASYNWMYLSSVVRPGDQMNRSVDTRQVVTDQSFNPAVAPIGPLFQFHATDYWIQGIMFGVTLSY